MRLIYNGPHPEVVVDELDQDQVIVRGEPVNVSDELGARLLMQDTWSESPDDTSAAGRAAAQKAKEEAEAKAAAEAKAQADADAAKATDAQDDSTKGNS